MVKIIRQKSNVLYFLKEHEVIVVIFLVLIVATVVSLVLNPFNNRNSNKDNKDSESSEVLGSDAENTPGEEPIDPETYEWKGSAENPRYIVFPEIETEAFVESVGLNEQKEIDVPSNTHLSGWYQDSAVPGENGLSIISGHLDGYRSPGVFSKLENAKVGDEFTVEKGDGSVLTYRVFSTITVPETESTNYLFSQSASVSSQLNLITCGGTFVETSGRYKDRVIVMSELLV